MACICTHLISGASAVSLVLRPEDWTRRGYSAVVLDRSQAPTSSLSLFCAGMLGGAVNEATVVSRDYLSGCTSSTPCFLFCPGLI